MERAFEAIKRFVDRGVVRYITEIEVKDLAEFAETSKTIFGFTVAMVVFEAITVNDDVFPAGESV